MKTILPASWKPSGAFTRMLLVFAIFGMGPVMAEAQTNTWDGSSNNNWNTAANWSLNQVPTALHDVIIPNGTPAVTVNTAAVCKTLSISNGNQAHTVTISGTNSLTVSGAVSIGNGTGNGDNKILAVGSGSLSCAAVTISATGNNNRTSELSLSIGTITVTGGITMGDLNNYIRFTGAGNLFVGGNISGGNLIPATGTVTCNGSAAQVITGVNTSSFYNLVISKTSTVNTVSSNTQALSVANDLTIITGTLALNATNADYNVTRHLLIQASGSLVNNVNFTASGRRLNVGGNWTNHGSFSPGNGRVQFNGTAAQQVDGTVMTVFNSWQINNAAGVSLSGIDVSVTGAAGSLVFQNGLINTGASKVMLDSDASITGAAAGRYVNGNLEMQVPTGSSARVFEIGTAGSYLPATIGFGNVTVSGSLLGFAENGDHPQSASFVIDESRNLNRYWRFVNTGISFTTYSAGLGYPTAAIDAGAAPLSFMAGINTGGTWSAPAVGSLSANSLSLNGATLFGDICIGEGGASAPVVQTQPSGASACVGASVSSFATASNKPNSTVQWEVSTDGGLSFSPLTLAPPYSNATTQLGATTRGTLTINPLSFSMNNYRFRAVFSNSRGSAVSNPFTLTVVNVTTSNAGSPASICIGTSRVLSANLASDGTGAWSIISGPSTNLSQISNTTSPTATFTPAGGLGVYQLQWTITNGSCSSSSTVAMTVVNAAANPNISFSSAAQLSSQTIMQCGPVDPGGENDIEIYNYTPPAGASYQWQVSTNAGPWTNIGASTANTQQGVATYAGTPGTHQFRVVMTTAAGCAVTSNVITLTVQSSSTIGGTALNTCSGSAFSSTFTGFPGLMLYTWSAPAVTGGMTGGAGSVSFTGISGTLVNNTAANQTATYTVTPTYLTAISPSCPLSFQVTVTVRPYPAINTSSAATSVCFKTTAQTTTLSYAGTTGSPTTYSITWNAAPANTFAAVTNAALPASPITINIPAGTNPGTYTGNITVSNAVTCVSLSKTFTLTVNALPTINSAATATTVCRVGLDQTSALTYAGTTGSPLTYSLTWNSAPPNSFPSVTNASLPASPISLFIPANPSPGNYTGNLTVTNANGCVSTVRTFNMQVRPMPAIDWSASAAPVCASAVAQTTTLNYSSTSNAPNSYSITWNPVPANSFTNVPSTSFSGNASGGVININVPANTAVGTYTATVSVTNSNGCSSNAFGFSLDVIDFLPSAAGTVSGISETCENVSGLGFSIPPVSGAVNYQWTLPSGWTINSGTGTNSISASAPAGSSSGLVQVAGANACGAGPLSQLNVIVNKKGTWLGNSGNWHLAPNWCGGLPDQNTDVIIPPGRPNHPVISSAIGTVRNLEVRNGATLTINNQSLRISGTVTANGNINALSGEIELSGTAAAQSLSGSMFVQNTLRQLTLSNPSGVTLSGTNDAFNISGLVRFGASNVVLQTNGNLVLLSRPSGTASIGDLTGGGLYSNNNITGDVTVERYISNQSKAWQLLSVPTSGQTIRQAWQENNVPLGNNRPGFGTIITSNLPNATSLGFDIGTAFSSGPGMKTLNPATGQWVGVPSTNIPIANSSGYMIFLRGDRSVTAFNQAPVPTILRTKGKLFTTGADAPPSINIGADQFASVGNPYASAIDFSKLGRTGGVQDVFYVWDPKLTMGPNSAYGLGGYQTIIGPGPSYTVIPGGGSFANGNTRIESGSAFLVRSVGTSGTIGFSESAKVNGSNLVTRAGSSRPVQQLLIKLSVVQPSGPVLLDGILAQFDGAWSADVDQHDVIKAGGTSEQLGLHTPEALLVAERRPLASVQDTVRLRIGQMRRQTYRFDIDARMFSGAGLVPILEDRYLRTSITLNQEGLSVVDFSVDDNAGSRLPDRFRICFRTTRTSLPGNTTVAEYSKGQAEAMNDSGTEEQGISVLPNPVSGDNFSLHASNLSRGSWQIRIFDQSGKVIHRFGIVIQDRQQLFSCQFPKGLAAGHYRVIAENPGNKRLYFNIIKVN